MSAYAGREIGDLEWETLLFPTKAEFHGISGGDDLAIETTADRLDLLCDAGLGLALGGTLGAGSGAPPILPGPPSRVGRISVASEVLPVRPFIAAVEVTPPPGRTVDAALLGEAIRFQELLHGTLGFQRRLASFGLYPLDRLTGPLRYTVAPPASLRFVPLEGHETVDAASFYATHPMAARYGAFGRASGGVLVLGDAAGSVLSLPPVLNAEGAGSVRPGDGAILLESTGVRAARVADGLGLLLLPFVAQGWSVTPVPVDLPAGHPGAVEPLQGPTLDLAGSTVEAIAGEPVPAAEATRALGAARLEAEATASGWRVRVPPWRPDLLGEVDLVEDLLIVRGYRAERGRTSAWSTRGRRRAESDFRDRFAAHLLGAGFQALFTTVLVPIERNQRLGRAGALAIAHPVSEEVGIVRDRLLPSLLGALAHNVRHGYPQRFGEVGPAVEPDANAESGARTSYRAGFVLAHDGAGFAEAAARVDALLRPFGANGVREPVELPGMVPGRSALLRVAGERIAEIGELHPAVLEAERVPVPVAYGEIDLTALWPLVRASETV